MDIDWRDRMRPQVDVSKMSSPVRCRWCQKVYDLGSVTVVQRYADCSVWKCPGCKVLVDDRGSNGWGGTRHYYELDEHGREMPDR
jgi:hypothetical protein